MILDPETGEPMPRKPVIDIKILSSDEAGKSTEGWVKIQDDRPLIPSSPAELTAAGLERFVNLPELPKFPTGNFFDKMLEGGFKRGEPAILMASIPSPHGHTNVMMRARMLSDTIRRVTRNFKTLRVTNGDINDYREPEGEVDWMERLRRYRWETAVITEHDAFLMALGGISHNIGFNWESTVPEAVPIRYMVNDHARHVLDYGRHLLGHTSGTLEQFLYQTDDVGFFGQRLEPLPEWLSNPRKPPDPELFDRHGRTHNSHHTTIDPLAAVEELRLQVPGFLFENHVWDYYRMVRQGGIRPPPDKAMRDRVRTFSDWALNFRGEHIEHGRKTHHYNLFNARMYTSKFVGAPSKPIVTNDYGPPPHPADGLNKPKREFNYLNLRKGFRK